MRQAQAERFVVGITDHMIPPPDLEAAVLDGIAEVDFLDCRREEDLDPERLARLDALLVWSTRIGPATVERLKRCRIVVRFGVGYDRVDVAALEAAGIPFCNNPDYGTEEVADHAVALILSLQRRLWEHDARARSYGATWQANTLTPLRRSTAATVGVVGVGRIGTAVVNRLKGFGHRILGYDPQQPAGHEKAVGYRRVRRLADLLADSDIVTFHCPLNAETRGLLDDRMLAAMKPGAILVNTARGELFAGLDPLERALRSGHLAAVGTDVLPVEPPAPHPLLDAWRSREAWLAGRLVVTPHNAFHSDEAAIEMRRNAAETVRLFLEDGTLRNRIRD
ncbi:C-terminal binding protein [Azospirillum picis]|uniref:D-3-phosphoglycerate dehydrogenase n=1 Tax=Azospirillum picis TaxID=488438 RepID=A0ABU0MR64_9PROT|nr:C-terminal binding protein [Azospirillum picis]MBP2302381.1 D-3-phosphoglycerate dehydrogenase [Azospirillum picis]MDQ0535960.1 D-3-phosphoglycerate dehydrogenase [Azospirillum picis]